MKKSSIKLTELYLDEVNMAVANYKNRANMKAIKNRMEELNNPTFNHEEFVMKNLICHEEIVIEIDKLRL